MDRRSFTTVLLVAGSTGTALAKPRRGQAIADVSTARDHGDAPPHAPPLFFPSEPTSVGPSSSWYLGGFELKPGSYYDNDGFDFAASYSRKNKLPPAPRLGVKLHSSGGYKSFVKSSFGPSDGTDIEVRTQDGQAKQELDKSNRSEWWCYGTDGQPYPARRVAAMLQVLTERYPQIDVTNKGIVYSGSSMGNGGVLHTMILPDPWRARIAYSKGLVGVFMPRRINLRNPAMYSAWPADTPENKAMWDAVDFEIQAVKDPIVRGMHYRHAFSTNDWFSRGPGDESTQLRWVKLCADNRISVAATWVVGSHSHTERGINLPIISGFEDDAQDVTLDRAHPCFTNSLGNFPLAASDITDRATYPRGHYNMGLTWDHAKIVDTADEIVFPLKYTARGNLGGGIPDQPARITVDVSPRRARHFAIRNGERIHWSWDGGAAAGTATVAGDVVTAVGVPMVSGAGYRRLRFSKVQV